MTDKSNPVASALREKGWLKANGFLIARRLVQVTILAAFLAGPVLGFWIVEGTLTSSLTLGVLPLTDPFVLLETALAGHIPEMTALTGAALVLAFYLAVGGRVYCSFICPINIVTDSAAGLRRMLGISKGWRPKRSTRYFALAMVMVIAAAGGGLAYELINPVTMVHRGLVFGMGWAWAAVAAIFFFDLIVAEHGWCGRLCPMGAFYGLIGNASLLRVRADNRDNCDDCMDCFTICPEPQVIAPALRGARTGHGPVIDAGACTNCGRCIDVCTRSVFTVGLRFDSAPNTTASKGVSP